jgi:hypothetical protein
MLFFLMAEKLKGTAIVTGLSASLLATCPDSCKPMVLRSEKAVEVTGFLYPEKFCMEVTGSRLTADDDKAVLAMVQHHPCLVPLMFDSRMRSALIPRSFNSPDGTGMSLLPG